jgi:predicted lipid-binding transport protein (Tim44 family)
MTPAAGRRGSRSASHPVRPASRVAVTLEPRAPAVAAAWPPPAPPPTPRAWRAAWLGLAAGILLGDLVLATIRHGPTGVGHEAFALGVAGIVGVAWIVRSRWARPRPPVLLEALSVAVTPAEPPPVPLTDLAKGIGDICRMDRGFDAARFAGYAAMTFRDVQHARMALDAGALRNRLVPAMNVELEASCESLRAPGRRVRVADVDVTAEVTEAWQDGNRDYVTAYVAGSMLVDTVDDVAGPAADGSPVTPTPVEAFLTFTRPSGLNFWMLSLIQGTAGPGRCSA